MATTPAHDPILFEVLRNELAAVTEEMSITVEHTGRSSMIRSGDFATAIADADGHVLGLHRGEVFFITGFTTVLAAALEKWGSDWSAGDVVVHNDPYLGGSHKPDIFVAMPVIVDGDLCGFTLAYSHQTDVGGRFPGGMTSQAANSYEEGIQLPAVKYMAGGVRNAALRDVLESNIRSGESFIADIEAKVAGCARGVDEFARVVARYGRDAVDAVFDYSLDSSERAARHAIAQLPDGDYAVVASLGDDGLGSADVDLPIAVKVSVRGDSLLVDLEGTAPQIPTAINMPFSNTRARIYDAFHSLLGDDVAFNAGFIRPIEINAPRGTILNPEFPAAVGGRVPAFIHLTEALFRALAEAMPGMVPVPHPSVDGVHFAGVTADGSEFSALDLIWGSWGARTSSDGVDGAASISFAGIPVELLERDVPVVVDELSLVPDTAGPGTFRGGLSVKKSYQFLSDASIMIRTNGYSGGGEGFAGGHRGSRPINRLISGDDVVELPHVSHMHLDVQAGQRLEHEVGGTAGYGDPTQRSADLVERDVATGRVSAEAARRDYGAELV